MVCKSLSIGAPSATTLSLILSMLGPAYCGLTGSIAINSFVFAIIVIATITNELLVRHLWVISVLVGPLLWSAFQWMLDLDDLTALVARDFETHEAVRMAYMCMGIFHGAISARGSRRQNVLVMSIGLDDSKEVWTHIMRE